MAEWKKVIVSGSNAELAQITASAGVTGAFFGDGTGLTGVSGEFPSTQYEGEVSTFESLKIFVNDGASKFITGGFVSESIYAGISGDITITKAGVASVNTTLTDTASVVIINQHDGNTDPDPIILLGIASNITDGHAADIYSLNTSGEVLKYDPSEKTLTVPGHLAVGDGTPTHASISSSATSFDFLPANVTTLNIGDAATSVNIGAAGASTVRIKGSASIDGDLTVLGTTTSINTTNLDVEDQFILLNSHSSAVGAAAPRDGGIVVQTSGSTTDGAIGTALYFDKDKNRWGLTESSSVLYDSTGENPDQYIVSVSSSNAAPSAGDRPHNFGLTTDDSTQYGMMFVDTSDTTNGGLYIYLPS